VEQLVRNLESKPSRNASSSSNNLGETPLTVRKMQDQLTSSLSTKVIIDRMKDGKGNIIIKFYNDDDLERLVDAISEK
jgi:ParB family transcriptional regulator, chromosome partitioning protein